MKICGMVEFAPTGLFETAKELITALDHLPETEAGVVDVVANMSLQGEITYRGANGGVKDPVSNFKSKSFEWAKDADIFIIHSSIPSPLKSKVEKAKTVFITHGTPEYCAALEFWENKPVWKACIDYVTKCDMTIHFEKRHARYWQFAEADLYYDRASYYIPKGIDIQRYIPIWELKQPIPDRDYFQSWMDTAPNVLFLESWRNINMPFHLLYAFKDVFDLLPSARLYMYNWDNSAFTWWKAAVQAGWHHWIRAWEPRLPDPRPAYRSAHMLVHPHWFGDKSRVSMEAMACGCPVIAHGSSDIPYNAMSRTGYDFADAIRDTILQVNNDIMRYGFEKISRRMREIAVKNFDIRNTAREMRKLFENDLMQRPARKDRKFKKQPLMEESHLSRQYRIGAIK